MVGEGGLYTVAGDTNTTVNLLEKQADGSAVQGTVRGSERVVKAGSGDTPEWVYIRTAFSTRSAGYVHANALVPVKCDDI